MRKNVFGRQFSRPTNQRKALFRSLISSLVLQENIKTTLEKAKAIKADADKIINRAKRGNDLLATQLLKKSGMGAAEITKIIKDLAPRFKNRTSGYTRILRLGRRFSDNAEIALIEWVEKKEFAKPLKAEIKALPARDEKPAKKEEKAKKDTKKKESKERKIK